MSLKTVALVATLLLAGHARADLATPGALVVVNSAAEVSQANDMVTVSFRIDETDKDKAIAESRANDKATKGVETLRRADPTARLKTTSYFTEAIEEDEKYLPNGTPDRRKRAVTGWRSGQVIEMETSNFAALPLTVTAAQGVVSVASISFGLSDAATKSLDDKRIKATYRSLNERVASIAAAMGRKLEDAQLEIMEVDGAGAGDLYFTRRRSESIVQLAPNVVRQNRSEPSFEPGETKLKMNIVAKVRFK